jgi:hypothetical protein
LKLEVLVHILPPSADVAGRKRPSTSAPVGLKDEKHLLLSVLKRSLTITSFTLPLRLRRIPTRKNSLPQHGKNFLPSPK